MAYKLKLARRCDLGRDYVLAQLHHEFIPGQGFRMTGTHHEIYLSDFRKVAPDKRRTILRQPVTTEAASGA